jgi:hypothetical protein
MNKVLKSIGLVDRKMKLGNLKSGRYGMKITSIILVLMVLSCASCETTPGTDAKNSKNGCCYLYQDYRWGDYPWEGKHENPAEVWDDYHRNYGRYWQGQEGETPPKQ